MTSKQSPTNLFRETNFEEINANLFCPRRNKKHEVIWSLFLALHDVIRGKEAVWNWSYWAIVLHWERLCSFFLSLLRRLILKDKFIFVREHGLNSNDSEAWRKKKIIVHVLTRFYLNMLKIKMRNSRNRRKFEFFTGYFLRR